MTATPRRPWPLVGRAALGWLAITVYAAACCVDWARTRGKRVDGIPTRRGHA